MLTPERYRLCERSHHLMPFLVVFMVVLNALIIDAAPQRKDPSCPAEHEIEPCVCRHTKDISIDCQYLTTKRFLDILVSLKIDTHQIKSLRIADSNLSGIPNGAFEGLQIEQLVLTGSNVSAIDNKALAALGESLQEIILNGNQLKQVPTDALSHLKSLKSLHLSHNKLEKLESYAFSKLESLKELHLEGNDITHVDTLAFGDCCRSLVTLNLASNLLTSVPPPESFNSLSSLEILRLGDNNIKSVNKGAFVGLRQLNTLDLSNNVISTIEDEAFTEASTHSLLLKKNKLGMLSEFALYGLEGTTEWIDLSYNRMASIPTKALRNFTILSHLDLSHNSIIRLNDDDFVPFGQHLRYVELDKNNMQNISSGALESLESVQFLMLTHNNLKKLSRETVDAILDTVYMLDVSDNPLVCGCDLEWLKEWLDTVHTIERVTPDPTCFIQGTEHMQYVRLLSCDHESGKLGPPRDHLCLDAECMKSLATFFSDRVQWH